MDKRIKWVMQNSHSQFARADSSDDEGEARITPAQIGGRGGEARVIFRRAAEQRIGDFCGTGNFAGIGNLAAYFYLQRFSFLGGLGASCSTSSPNVLE
jgi:hypothetical protein